MGKGLQQVFQPKKKEKCEVQRKKFQTKERKRKKTMLNQNWIEGKMYLIEKV